MRKHRELNTVKNRPSAKKRTLIISTILALTLALSVGLPLALAGSGSGNVTLHLYKNWNYMPVGLPVEVEDLPGDRKTALLWENPISGSVAYFQIKANGFNWEIYPLSMLTLDHSAGTNGKWYLLFENLPDGTRLVNNIEYTFLIRAVDSTGYVGPAFEIRSTPLPLGDIGGRNTDVVSVYGINVMPSGGWETAASSGTASDPHRAAIEMPSTVFFSTLHRNYVDVGEDATFIMYSDPGFTIETELVDRMDYGFVWLSEVHLYLKVTSGNGELVKYYDITVRPQ